MVGRVDLNDRRSLRRSERGLEHSLRVMLLLIVVAGDRDDEACLGFRNEEVRAIRVLGHKSAAVEGGDRADPVRPERRRTERERSAETIALHASALSPVRLLLPIEEGEER